MIKIIVATTTTTTTTTFNTIHSEGRIESTKIRVYVCSDKKPVSRKIYPNTGILKKDMRQSIQGDSNFKEKRSYLIVRYSATFFFLPSLFRFEYQSVPNGTFNECRCVCVNDDARDRKMNIILLNLIAVWLTLNNQKNNWLSF